MSYVLILLMAIDVVGILVGYLYSSFYIQWGQGYKEGNRIDYNKIPIRTLSLLA
jgi:hypothetical protein